MKKVALLLVIALVLGLSAMTYPAKPTEHNLIQGPAGLGTDAEGSVFVSFPKLSGPELDDFGIVIGRLQAHGLDPDLDYWVYSQDEPGDEFVIHGKVKVNKNGLGHVVITGNTAWQEYDPLTGWFDVSFELGIVDTNVNPKDTNVVLYAEVFWPPNPNLPP